MPQLLRRAQKHLEHPEDFSLRRISPHHETSRLAAFQLSASTRCHVYTRTRRKRIHSFRALELRSFGLPLFRASEFGASELRASQVSCAYGSSCGNGVGSFWKLLKQGGGRLFSESQFERHAIREAPGDGGHCGVGDDCPAKGGLWRR